MSPRDAAPTRAAILAAADRLLEEGGPDAVTLRSVGDAAGVSRSAPYRHYADKADLLRAVAARTLTALATRIRSAAAAPGEGGPLRRGALGYLAHAAEHPRHYLLVFGDTPIADPDAALEAAADDGMAALRELVEHAQQTGELPPGRPREVATLLWVILHGLAQLRITGHLHEPRTLGGDAAVPLLVDEALRGLGRS